MTLLENVIFATDFTSASTNAGLYGSGFSKRLGTNLVVAHGFALIQAALEVEMDKPLHSQQRAKLQFDLACVGKEARMLAWEWQSRSFLMAIPGE